jgi:hypothetical protein
LNDGQKGIGQFECRYCLSTKVDDIKTYTWYENPHTKNEYIGYPPTIQSPYTQEVKFRSNFCINE